MRIGPDPAPLEQIFDQKIMDFFGKMIFWIFDKSAGSADNNEKMLGKIVYLARRNYRGVLIIGGFTPKNVFIFAA